MNGPQADAMRRELGKKAYTGVVPLDPIRDPVALAAERPAPPPVVVPPKAEMALAELYYTGRVIVATFL